MISRMYAVEITKNRKLIIMLANVLAVNPLEATVLALRTHGYDKNNKDVKLIDRNKCSNEIPGSMMIARVTLLGGKRESVSYYEVM